MRGQNIICLGFNRFKFENSRKVQGHMRTGQGISLNGKVPVEILPEKRIIT